jgi:hypothetical protein
MGKILHGWEILVTNSLILFRNFEIFENENEKKFFKFFQFSVHAFK